MIVMNLHAALESHDGVPQAGEKVKRYEPEDCATSI